MNLNSKLKRSCVQHQNLTKERNFKKNYAKKVILYTIQRSSKPAKELLCQREDPAISTIVVRNIYPANFAEVTFLNQFYGAMSKFVI